MYSREDRVDMEMIQDDDDVHADLVHMVMCGDDGNGVIPNPSADFDAMGTTTTVTEKEIWQLDEREHQDTLLEVNDSSSNIFYDDQFPVLPDFSCMSSSSSSSSTPATTKPMFKPSASSTSTSSSTASWALLNSDGEEDVENKVKIAPVASGATVSSSTLSVEGLMPSDSGEGALACMDVLENFGDMDLFNSNDIWDASSIFDQTPQELVHLDEESKQDEQVPLDYFIHQEGRNGNRNNDVVQDGERPLDEMGSMFFEWLKSNKDSISAEDMRNIKIKSSTIECAKKRLGSSKEGQKQLLKLILEWVAQYQLRKKREAAAADAANQYPYPCQEPPPQAFPNPNRNFNYSCRTHPTADPYSCFSSPPWMPPVPPMHHPYVTDPATRMMMAPPPPMPYMVGAHSYNNPGLQCANTNIHREYQMISSSQSWNQSEITGTPSHFTNSYLDHVGNNMVRPGYVAEQYPYPPLFNGNNDQMPMRSGFSATKEARKKRMARQRRYSWTYHHPRHQQQQQNHQNQANYETFSNKNMGNWAYWAAAAPGVTSMQMMATPPPLPPQPIDAQVLLMPIDAELQPHPQPPRTQKVDRSTKQEQNGPKPTPPTDKKQGWKSEKNLKFLLQKVLKQSDVGCLGRIVLPKKEAETHLPELESGDGISISMEDIGTSSVWNMRYRFWPNNKSRMYLLENTGDFVKANGLQEGDFIVLYSDMKCGKYMIRGVKVREPGTKPEVKKSAKRNQRS